MKRCLTCDKTLGQSAQRAKTGPNSTIKYCRACFGKSLEFKDKASKGWFKKGALSTPKPFKKGQRAWNRGLGTGARTQRRKETEWAKMAAWRSAVYERDNYTCQDCGERGGKLNADHIKMWSLYPKLRYDIDNGQTLCKPCHQIKTSKELKMYWTNQYKKAVGVHTTARQVG